MMSLRLSRTQRLALLGFFAGFVGMTLTVQLAFASPPRQSESEGDSAETLPDDHPAQGCQECHLDITNSWVDSPHAHAFDDAYFQEQWLGQGEPGDCLTCHTTGYDATTGSFVEGGVACVGCHGETPEEHPPQPLEIRADADYCGTCHTTTHSEWRLTGHFSAEVGCSDCHDPHNQQPLFAEPDELCVNCHKEEDLGAHVDNAHIEAGVGCVDCHAVVIPPEQVPEDGIVSTGHGFNITAETCVACHTDSLAAGMALPGYEDGPQTIALPADGSTDASTAAETDSAETETLSAEQRVDALEAALASQNTTLIFQGAFVGLVLGGTTAWYVARNTRGNAVDETEQDDDGRASGDDA